MIKSIIEASFFQTELAEILGIDRRSLYNRFNHPEWWTLGEIEKLAEALKLPVGTVTSILLGDKKVYEKTINQIIKRTNGKH